MIIYNRLWDTMALKGVTQYKLITSGISHSTLTRLKNNQPVNTDTLNKLCSILDCRIEEIVEYKKGT
ncbi:DNA-binding Xre family transcriptional regulator [Ruminococcaceae bacterium R-25]|nr:DNA-binding Xre family transcriptional regulator [Ruminococcaceae bacterium R-25]SUQ11011.1 DNA-binding transcriptional regulator, XRE family [Oscillospiraceae bacterium]